MGRSAAIVLALLASLSVPLVPPGSAAPPRALDLSIEGPQWVVWDPRIGSWDAWDVGYAGASEATALLEGWGYSVSLLTLPLPDVVALLRPGDALVLPLGRDVRYAESDMDVVEDFVARGGGVLVLGEHNGHLETLEHQNPLLARFGLAFNDLTIEDPRAEPTHRSWIITDVPAWGVTNVMLPFPAAVDVEPPGVAVARASPEATVPSAPVIAEREYGDGVVVALGDAEWFWNGDASYIGLHRRNNTLLLRALAERLTGTPAQEDALVEPDRALVAASSFELAARVAPGASVTVEADGATVREVPSAAPGERRWRVDVARDGVVVLSAARGADVDRDVVRVLAPPAEPDGRAVLLLDGAARRPHAGPSGLLDLALALRDAGVRVEAAESKDVDLAVFDVALLVSPLRSVADLAERAESAPHVRWLVAAEPWSSIEDCDLRICESLRIAGARDRARPLEDLQDQMRATIPHGTAVGPSLVPQSVEAVWAGSARTRVTRAAPVVTERVDMLIGLALPRGAWVERSAAFLNPDPSTRDLPRDFTLAHLLLISDRSVVSGDADAFTNALAHPGVLASASGWARSTRVELRVPAAPEPGLDVPVLVTAHGRAASAIVVTLPSDMVPLFGPGTTMLPGGNSVIRVEGPGPVAFEVKVPLSEGWRILSARAEYAGAPAIETVAPVRLPVAELLLRVDAPTHVETGSPVRVNLTVVNAGDATAFDPTLTLNVSLAYAPDPLSEDEVSGRWARPVPTQNGWSYTVKLEAVPRGAAASADVRLVAPRTSGTYELEASTLARSLRGITFTASETFDQLVQGTVLN